MYACQHRRQSACADPGTDLAEFVDRFLGLVLQQQRSRDQRHDLRVGALSSRALRTLSAAAGSPESSSVFPRSNRASARSGFLQRILEVDDRGVGVVLGEGFLADATSPSGLSAHPAMSAAAAPPTSPSRRLFFACSFRPRFLCCLYGVEGYLSPNL
jgi:hypothetical protein